MTAPVVGDRVNFSCTSTGPVLPVEADLPTPAATGGEGGGGGDPDPAAALFGVKGGDSRDDAVARR